MTVGTPPVTVTFSASKSCKRLSASRYGPGKLASPPQKRTNSGNPHAQAWNMGTIGSTTSRSAMPSPAQLSRKVIVCSMIDRCVYTIPLGFPVVPEV